MDRQMGSGRPDAIHLHHLHRPVVDAFPLFKEKMLESPYVSEVSGSLEEPTGENMDAMTFDLNGVDEGEKRSYIFPVDEDFLRFYDQKILGKDMPEDYNYLDSADYYILNETAANMLSDNPEDLLGSQLSLHYSHPGFIWPGPVIGIVEDFHFSGLEFEITPMVIFPKYTWMYCFSILPEGNPENAVNHLKMVWQELFPDYPLEYQTMKELPMSNCTDRKSNRCGSFPVSASFPLVIAGLGLFALSGYFMQRRVKPSAIRRSTVPECAHHGAPSWLTIFGFR
ncbi:MAG: hypothetical protein R2751_16850 [Bacteroidales bacterium]